MDEGVDPTKMCQSLVDKVAQSKQLLAVAHHPELLKLFENWLEELEDEVLNYAETHEPEPASLAEATGLSRSGAMFIIAKLRREGRLEHND